MRLRKMQDQMDVSRSFAEPEIGYCVDILDLEKDWLRIEQERHVSVHQSFAWCRAWVTHKKVTSLFITYKINGQIEFILPLEVCSKFGIKAAYMIGSEHSNVNFALASSDFMAHVGDDFVKRFRRDIAKMKLSLEVIVLDRMRLQFKGIDNPFASVVKTLNQNASFQLELQSDMAATLAQVNGKRKRKKFRVSEKRINTVGNCRYEVAQNFAQCEKVLNTFFEQKSKRLEERGLPSVFADQQTKDFFSELSQIDAKQPGKLELHYITMTDGDYAGAVLAIAAITVTGDHAICQFASFHEELATKTGSSPGEYLFHFAIEDCIDRKLAVFDFGIGDQAYKRSWCTDKTDHYDGTIALNGFGHLYATLSIWQTNFKRKIKSSDQLNAIVSKLFSRRICV